VLRITAALSLSVASLAVAPAREVPVAPPPRAAVHYFPTTVGARWVYRGPDRTTFEEVVSKVEPEPEYGRTLVTVLRVGAEGKTTPEGKYEVSSRGVLQVETAISTDGSVTTHPMDPPIWVLQLPAEPGARWFAGAQVPNGARISFEAGKPERVKVPAGEYDTIPVEMTAWQEGRDGLIPRGASFRVWYAPGIGTVKWTTFFGVEGVLETFDPGKGE
jgi:hypothetical protein